MSLCTKSSGGTIKRSKARLCDVLFTFLRFLRGSATSIRHQLFEFFFNSNVVFLVL